MAACVVKYDPKMVRDISEAVYRMRLGDDDTQRMLAKDNDGGEKLRGRAKSYDSLTRCYLEVLEVQK
jgi:hypothetical protein